MIDRHRNAKSSDREPAEPEVELPEDRPDTGSPGIWGRVILILSCIYFAAKILAIFH
ncbi:hypothetical protein [Tropicimonas sp. IMCC34043]|uniref:hypothetical protein n=1 Tax=Tropicimonas sp. IMCC34043 TaxID=2248760 RepID=UPI0013008B3C|nr:hypothetical protein [Tropicimonas sp. IMCC34043]